MASAQAINLEASRSVAGIVGSTMRLYSYYPWLFFILAAGVWVPWISRAWRSLASDRSGTSAHRTS
jgi:hypothetical protein